MVHCRFCAHLKLSNNTEILTPFLPKVMDGLLTMATQSTDDVLALVLESLRIVMSVSRLLLQTRFHAFALELVIDVGKNPLNEVARLCDCELFILILISRRAKGEGGEHGCRKCGAPLHVYPPPPNPSFPGFSIGLFFHPFVFFHLLSFSSIDFPLHEHSNSFTYPLLIRPIVHDFQVSQWLSGVFPG